MVYKPTYNWGAPSCIIIIYQSGKTFTFWRGHHDFFCAKDVKTRRVRKIHWKPSSPDFTGHFPAKVSQGAIWLLLVRKPELVKLLAVHEKPGRHSGQNMPKRRHQGFAIMARVVLKEIYW